jgi:hypothetical protein
MKKTTFVFGLICTALLATFPADAQQRSQPPYDTWCREMQMGWGGSGVKICMAYTFEQCMASRTSHTETCYLNPIYDPRNKEWRARNPNY